MTKITMNQCECKPSDATEGEKTEGKFMTKSRLLKKTDKHELIEIRGREIRQQSEMVVRQRKERLREEEHKREELQAREMSYIS